MLPGAALVPCSQALHDTVLPGKLLLQVDEVVNIAAAVRERYSGNDGGHRCLKLLLTDGGCWNATGGSCATPGDALLHLCTCGCAASSACLAH